jgi:hypothetical protein
MPKMSALSIQQPNAEQILRGKKKIEYRSMPTNKRERVYIYASKTPHTPKSWKEIGMEPGDLPTGFLVGSLKSSIVDIGMAATSGIWRSRKD